MPNTRFIRPTDNRTTTTVAVLKNGAGGPALIQDAAYPMSNLLNKDRYSVWATGVTAADPITVHIDMGTTASIRALAVLGLSPAAGGFNPLSCTVGFRTAAQGYASDPATYTLLGTITQLSFARDAWLEVSPTSMRYLQFQFQMPGGGWGNGFSLGKVLASSSISDLGLIYSPGAGRAIVTPQVRTRTQAGIPVLTTTGLPYARFSLPFRMVTTTTLSALSNVAGLTDAFLYIDQNGTPFECLPSGDEWSRSHRWSPPDAWDVDLEIEQLP